MGISQWLYCNFKFNYYLKPISQVVTGSSEGIGKAYARELAKRGVNIVLISRGENRLYRTAEDISMFD